METTPHTTPRAGAPTGAPRVRAVRLAAVAAALLLAACGGGSDAVAGPGGGNTPRSDLPAALAGTWVYGNISPTNFWNSHTGQYAGNAYGFADYLALQANGTYTRLVYIYSNVYGCQTQVWTEMKGTLTADGEAFTLYPTQGRYKVADNCAASRNYERPMTGSEVANKQGETFTWERTQQNGKTYILVNAPGSSDAPVHYEWRP